MEVNMQAADATLNKSNHLAGEKSPYLLQHASNPVDWYPWGEEAFQRARQEEKPIFLSIGYATCHWCHVMAHESFEDEDVAELLNKNFIAIKLDREERPDVDMVYMAVCQRLTGSGGWPLSIFMTNKGNPFFAGTYFPKHSRVGMPGFMDILNRIVATWKSDRELLIKESSKITYEIQPLEHPKTITQFLNEETLKQGYLNLERSFDPKWGGFGRAPKFPTPHQLTFLLRWYKRSHDVRALDMVEKTLDAMRRGGLFDQIGFGFHRYSVDQKWMVPHFEKMLYDQAQLAMAYIEIYQITGKKRFGQVAREIFTYVLRDMTSPEGGFYCAEDADSEGKEGLFYLWTPKEVNRHLGKDTGNLVCSFYNITEAGNFEEGFSIPHIPTPLAGFVSKTGMESAKFENLLDNARSKLFDIRNKRIHPLKDDKILTSWNGLMIAALAKGYQVLGDQEYIGAAGKAADFILKNLRTKDAKLLHRYRYGDAAYSGFLDDYAFLVWGLIELHEATFEVGYLEEAIALNRAMLDMFWDEQNGGLYFSGKENESLIIKTKDLYDGAIPSGNAVAALNLLRLGRMTGNVALEKKAEQLIGAASGTVRTYPASYTQLLGAIDFLIGPSREIVIAGDPALTDTREMIKTVQRKFLPNKVLLFHPAGPDAGRLVELVPFVKNMLPRDGRPTAYVCKNFACQAPITDINKLEPILK
jgi:uncharacterized protein YyaL (SSP411 family)